MLKFKDTKEYVIALVLGLVITATNVTAQGYNPQTREFSPDDDYSSEIEKRIRSGELSTAGLIVDYRPRLWIKGDWDWNKKNVGSFAWRIVHGKPTGMRNSANDQHKYEFCDVARKAEIHAYGKTGYGEFGRRYLWTIVAAEARARLKEWNFPADLPATSKRPDYAPKHTADELLADARAKLLTCVEEGKDNYNYVGATAILTACVAYDWLVDRKYSDGVTPVLSKADRTELQKKIINVAEYMRRDTKGKGNFFNGAHIAKYCYFIAGLALYEPSGQGISASNNKKAKQYLDEFDEYWIGKILPVLNEQGGTGGWHAGFSKSHGGFFNDDDIEMFIYSIAPFLFAHYTATGQSIENSVFSTGVLKYAVEFQNYMIYPNNEIGIGGDSGNRYQWIAPLFVTSRRRFSSDLEQRWLGELSGWVRSEKAPARYVEAGSYCMFDQLMWEEKWPNPRSANKLGCDTRFFAKLGWVCMRSGFTSPDDLAALFVCQRYHWSKFDLYAQNSFHIMRKGWLIEGNSNTIYIDNQCQRPITYFPTVANGIQAYSPGSMYDVGPGIQTFKSTAQYDYMFGDATNAYDNKKLEKFTRALVWLKRNNIFVIFDRVVTKEVGTKKSWVINPGSFPQTIEDRLVKITNGDGALWIHRLLPEHAEVNLNNNGNSGIKFFSCNNNKKNKKHSYKFEVTPTQSAKEDFFLHVIQAVDANFSKDSPQVIANEAKLIRQGDQIGVRVSGWEILFDKSGGQKISVAKVQR